MNCRSVSDETWQQARRALVFYFSRRVGVHNAEDVAHETLAAVLKREDFEFEHEQDFLRVCYAFAARVGKHEHRREMRFRAEELTDQIVDSGTELRPGLQGPDFSVFLDRVVDLAECHLSEDEWLLIRRSVIKATGDEVAPEHTQDERASTKFRVRLHRARKKLASLSGWRKEV